MSDWRMSPQNQHRLIYDFLKHAAAVNPKSPTFLRRRPSGQGSLSFTYSDLLYRTDCLIAGWIDAGIQKGDRVLLLCDPSSYWFIIDTSILSVGAVSVPRATDVTDDDILYIANHSEATLAIVQNSKTAEKLNRLRPQLPTIQRVIVIEDNDSGLVDGIDTISSVLRAGEQRLKSDQQLINRTLANIDENALATLIYTSGTTGAPKGVMLSQKNWITATMNTTPRLAIQKEDVALSLLPPWHAFERIIEYAVVSLGVPLVISDINSLRDDLKLHRPSVFPSVPRIWESVYNGIIGKIQKEPAVKRAIFQTALRIGIRYNRCKATAFGYDLQIERPPFVITLFRRLAASLCVVFMLPLRGFSLLIFRPVRQALGGRLKVSASGGSALPAVVDRFLSAVGITVIEGYGMTETAAIISVRSIAKPTSGTVGAAIDGYTLKLKNEKGEDVSSVPGAKGTLWIKSDQILSGYFKRPELNEIVFDKDGFFDTGDLMTLTYKGELVFAGRSKDTIALLGGENIEPVPIEDRLLESELIDQVMVVGDEYKTLAALIVPDFDRVRGLVDAPKESSDWNQNPAVRDLFQKEIGRLLTREIGFKSFEIVPKNAFYILPRQFDLETEMTKTLKMKRPVIKDHFESEIAAMYKS